MGISNTIKILEKRTSFMPYRRKISYLRKKRIAIDTAIFMWKFKTSESPLGLYQFILFLNILLRNETMPIFIFDGKSTILKKKEQEKRKERNKKILDLIKEYEASGIDDRKLEKLKIASRIVTVDDWNLITEILDHYMIPHHRVHEREAEGYCSYLNRTDQVDFVMTEDTDVFMYGAVKWIRHINIYTGDVHIYDLNTFRRFLGITDKTIIVNLCMLFGTDFNDPIMELSQEAVDKFLGDPEKYTEKLKKLINNYEEIVLEFISNDYGPLTKIDRLETRKIPDLSIYKGKIPVEYEGIIFPADVFCIKNVL